MRKKYNTAKEYMFSLVGLWAVIVFLLIIVYGFVSGEFARADQLFIERFEQTE